jgi:autotransporter passenger strand-loop-strand repeat protein
MLTVKKLEFQALELVDSNAVYGSRQAIYIDFNGVEKAIDDIHNTNIVVDRGEIPLATNYSKDLEWEVNTLLEPLSFFIDYELYISELAPVNNIKDFSLNTTSNIYLSIAKTRNSSNYQKLTSSGNVDVENITITSQNDFFNYSSLPRTTTSVPTELITFFTWAQSGVILFGDINYEQYTPTDPNYIWNAKYTGCTATATAQLFYYWGNLQVNNGQTVTVPSLTLDSSDYFYLSNWSDFSDRTSYYYTDENAYDLSILRLSEINDKLHSIDYDLNPDEIAALVFGIGVKVNSIYSTFGTATLYDLSGVSDFFLENGYATANNATLYNTFWDPITLARYDYTLAHDILIDNLSNDQPVIIGLFDLDGVDDMHTAIIDGYNPVDNTFHFNMGWGNGYEWDLWVNHQEDGWYSLYDLPRGYDYMHEVAYNIVPVTVDDINPASIEMGETVSGNLSVAREQDFYYLSLDEAYTNIGIQFFSEEINSFAVIVYDSNLRMLSNISLGRQQYTFSEIEAGDYYIRVNNSGKGKQTGAYQLALSHVTSAAPKPTGLSCSIVDYMIMFDWNDCYVDSTTISKYEFQFFTTGTKPMEAAFYWCVAEMESQTSDYELDIVNVFNLNNINYHPRRGEFYWRVRAYDSTDVAGFWSELDTFSVFTMNVTNGVSVGHETVSHGTQQIGNGYGYEIKIKDDGIQNVYSFVGDTIISSGGTQNILLDGGASGTAIYSGGIQNISSGGSDFYGLIYSGGRKNIYAGGSSYYTEVNSGGVMAVSFGGYVSEIDQLSGGAIIAHTGATILNGHNDRIDGNSGFSIFNGIASNFLLNSGGSLSISGEHVAHNTIINSGARETVEANGTANATTINSGGIQNVIWGTTNSAVINNGGLLEISGGSANYTQINSDGRMALSSGAIVNNTFINSGGVIDLAVGASAGNIDLHDGGVIVAETGALITDGYNNRSDEYNTFSMIFGIASNFVLNSGGMLNVNSGHYSVNTFVNSSGVHNVSGGGDGSNTRIENGGIQNVFSDGTVRQSVITSGGIQNISSGGNAVSSYIKSGGYMNIDDGGTASDIQQFAGGVINTNTGASIVGGVNERTDGFNDFSIVNGVAINFLIDSGSNLVVYNDHSANNTVISHGGFQFICFGGYANETTINSGGSQVIDFEGVSDFNTINTGGVQEVFGLSYNTTINSIYSGEDFFILGTQYIFESGVAYDTYIDGGVQDVSYGGTAYDTIINGWNEVSIQIISSDGIAQGSILEGDSIQEIGNGGTVYDTTINFLSYQTISSGGVAENSYINESGTQRILTGGTAFNTFVNSGGSQIISSGGIAHSVTIAPGGILSVRSEGLLSGGIDISSGLLITDSVVEMTNADDQVNLFGSANLISATLSLTGGGNLNIAGVNNNVNSFSISGGGVLNFNITQFAEPNTEIMLTDITGITTDVITVSMDSSHDYGSYLLAGNATGFSDTITVYDDGSALGTVTLGNNLMVGDTTCSLSIANDNLVFDVFTVDTTPPSVPTGLTAEIVDGKINFDWHDSTDNLAGIRDYDFFITGGDDNEFRTPVSESEFINYDMPQEGIYHWTVFAYDKAGNYSDWASYVRLVVDLTAPDVPTGMTDDVTGNNVALDWNDTIDPLSGLKEYVVEYHSEFSDIYFNETVTVSEHNLSELGSGSWSWRVKSIDESGNESEWSSEQTFEVSALPFTPIVSSGMHVGDEVVVGGTQVVLDGGTTTINKINESGTQEIETGGIAYDTAVNSGGSQIVYLGGVTESSYIGENGVQEVYGTASGTTINTIPLTSGSYVAGIQRVYDSGVSYDTYIVGGCQDVAYGGASYDTILNGWNDLSVQDIRSGGYTQGSVLDDNSFQYIYDGGSAYDTTINFWSYQLISSGGIADVVEINESGTQEIKTGGIAAMTAINSGGLQIVSSGGEAYDTAVNSGGSQIVDLGGVTESSYIGKNGVQEIKSGGIAAMTEINSGGSQTVSFDGEAYDTTVNDGGLQFIDFGGVAFSSIINGTGIQDVRGEVYDTTVNGAYSEGEGVFYTGVQYIQDSGISYDTYVNGGIQDISFGGVAFCSILEGWDISSEQFIYSGGVTQGTLLLFNGIQYIEDGGVAYDTVVNEYSNQIISEGGLAEDNIVNESGTQEIKSGGIAAMTEINSGGLQIVSFGGIADDTMINGDGHQLIESGGIASDTTIIGGWIFENGDAQYAYTSQTVLSGGIAVDTVIDGGYQDVQGTAINVVNNAGSMHIQSGGQLSGLLQVNMGSVETDSTVTMSQATDQIDLIGGADMEDVAFSLTAGGSVNISGEQNDAGNITITGGGALNFNITQFAEPNTEIMLTDITGITTDVITVSMDSSHDYGSYLLAGNATGFSDTITVYDDGSALGTVTLGNNLMVGDTTCSLSIANDNLVFDVFTVDTTPPSVPMSLTDNVTGDSAALDWSDSTDNKSGVKEYVVEYAENDQFTSATSQIVVSSELDLSSLADMSTYYWRVKAVDNSDNQSAWSATDTFSIDIADTTAPSVPTSLTDNVTDDSAALDWSDSTDNKSEVKEYVVEYADNDQFIATTRQVAMISELDLSDLADGSYYWRVKTFDNAGNESEWSQVESFEISSVPFTLIVNSGMHVSSEIVAGGSQTVLNGGITTDQLINSGGSQLIFSEGIGNDTTINSGGSQRISSGGVANTTIVNSSGVQTVLNSGVANSATINSGGWQVVASGGIANTTIVDSGGWQSILSGGVVNLTTVNSGSFQHISSGGEANLTTVNSDGFQYINSGAAGNNTMVNSGGSQLVASNGVAESTTINFGGSQHVSSGGVANSTIVSSGAYQYINGLTSQSEVQSDGIIMIGSGGSAIDFVISSGGIFGWGFDAVFNGTSNGVIITSSDSQTSYNLYLRRTEQHVLDGYTAISTTAYSVGYQFVSSGGVANSTNISGGGQHVSSGGVANSTTVHIGYQQVYSGVANSTIVNSSGRQVINSGGIGNDTLINSGGSQRISSGGVANTTIVNSSGIQTVLNGGVANSATINSSGGQDIASGGIANTTIVNSGGWQHVRSGGLANLTTLNSGGWMHISYGGITNSTTVNSSGGMLVLSDGVANSTTVNSDGGQHVRFGGTANTTMVNSGGWQYVSSGGVAITTMVNSGGNMFVSSGGQVAGVLTVAGGHVTIVAAISLSEVTTVAYDLNTADDDDVLVSVSSGTLGSGSASYSLNLDSAVTGSYILAAGFDLSGMNGKTFSVTNSSQTVDLTVGSNYTFSNGNQLLLSFTDGDTDLLTATYTVELSDTTAPTIPAGLTDSVSVDTASLDWSESTDNKSGIKEYIVEYSSNAVFSDAVSQNVSSSELDISSLTDGTYYWRVKSVDNAGNNSEWSTVDSFEVDITAPNTPTGLTFDVTGNDIVLDWDDSTDNLSGIKEYIVEYDDNAGFAGASSNNVVNSILAVNNPNGGYLYWRIKAIDNNDNESSWSTGTAILIDNIGNSFDDATAIDIDEYYTCAEYIGLGDGYDYYTFEVLNVTEFDIALTDLDAKAMLCLYEYDSDKDRFQKIKSASARTDKITGETTAFFSDQLLDSGTYYLQVTSGDRGRGRYNTDYKLEIYAEPLPAPSIDEFDFKNDTGTFNILNLDDTGFAMDSGWVGFGDAKDVYCFTPDKAGLFNIELAGLNSKTAMKVWYYDEAKDRYKGLKGAKGSEKTGFAELEGLLLKGDTDYYVEIISGDKGKGKCNTAYDLDVDADLFPEATDNNSWQVATEITPDFNLDDGFVGFGDACDYFKFEVDDLTTFDFDLTGDDKNAKLTVFRWNDKKGKLKKIANTSLKYGEAHIDNLNLDAGMYYVEVLSSDKGKGKYNTEYDLDITLA